MISTYIYGSPHGFNFYEGVASWNDYFKSFYISTRKGKRLMVNRKDDGTTVYSFLCYGLMEKEGRPNAFFGCSVIIGGDRYSPDLKELFEWFDYLFGRIVERGSLFFVNDGGIIQYKVDRFSDISDEIDWLKSNLPNIFTKSSDITLLPYDATYTTRNLGKVICCNIDTPVQRIVDDFRKSHWLAISPGFKPEEELEEMNFADLSSRLNEYNQKILAVAVNPSADDVGLLKTIQAECADVIESLRKYHKAVQDEVEKQNCTEIREKYANLSGNIAALLKKIPQTSGPAVPPAGFVAEPPRVDPPRVKTRICRKCHAKKPVSAFTRYVDVCDDCAKAKPQTYWWENIKSTHAAAAIVAVIVLVSAFLIIKPHLGKSEEEEKVTDREDVSITDSNSFDVGHFDRLLADGKFYEAYGYADSNGKKDRYADDVKNALAVKYMEILENTRPYSYIYEKAMDFTTVNRRVLEALGYNVNDLNLQARSWQELSELIKDKYAITESDQAKALGIIATLPADWRETWRNRLASMRVERRPTSSSVVIGAAPGTADADDMNFQVTVVNTDRQGNVLSTETIDAVPSVEKSFRSGTTITVTASKGKKVSFDRGSGVPINNKKTGVRLDLDINTTPVVFTIGNMKLTVNVSSASEFEYVPL